MNTRNPLAAALLLIAAAAAQAAAGDDILPVETIAAYTPPAGAQWASPDCQHIPCKLADSPGAGAAPSSLPYDQQPGFVGPPAPRVNSLNKDAPDASDEARGFGEQAAADAAAVSGTSDSNSAAEGPVAASGGAAAGDNDAAGDGDAAQVLKTKADALESIEITYTRLQKAEADIKGAAGAFNNGRMTGFAAPNAPTPGTVGGPPVDEKHLGKIQAAANE